MLNLVIIKNLHKCLSSVIETQLVKKTLANTTNEMPAETLSLIKENARANSTQRFDKIMASKDRNMEILEKNLKFGKEKASRGYLSVSQYKSKTVKFRGI